MTFEELFDCADLADLCRLEREVLEQQDDAERAQVELTARFLSRQGTLITHFVLYPTSANVCAVFADGSKLWLEELPQSEWYSVFQAALRTMHGTETKLDCLDAGRKGCFVQLDIGGLTPLHPRRVRIG